MHKFLLYSSFLSFSIDINHKVAISVLQIVQCENKNKIIYWLGLFLCQHCGNQSLFTGIGIEWLLMWVGALWFFKGNAVTTFYRRQSLNRLFPQSCNSSPLVKEEIINRFASWVSYRQKKMPCISWGFHTLF